MGKPVKIKYGFIVEYAYNDARTQLGPHTEDTLTSTFVDREFHVSLRAIELIIEKLEHELTLAPKQRKIDMQGHSLERELENRRNRLAGLLAKKMGVL